MNSMNVEIVKQLADYFQEQTPQYTVNPEAASQHTVIFGPICLKMGPVLSLYVLNMHQLLTFILVECRKLLHITVIQAA